MTRTLLSATAASEFTMQWLRIIGFSCLVFCSFALTTEEIVANAILQAKIELENEISAASDAEGVPNTQQPTEEVLALQDVGALLERATQIIVEHYGSPVLAEAGKLNVTGMVEDLLGGRAKRYAEQPRDISKCVPKIQRCQASTSVRSITGICNNLQNPNFGAAQNRFRRLQPAQYDDGVGTIRSKSKNGGTLPSAREISNKLFAQTNYGAQDTKYNHLLQQFGQFVAHDLVLTPSSAGPKGRALDCTICDPRKADKNCAPIAVPARDSYFGSRGCIRFTRALNAQQGLGQRQQINQNTHFLDLSTVYGNDECVAKKLRAPKGKLQLPKPSGFTMLPQDRNDSNCQSSPRFYCFLAGDLRNTLHPALVPFHVYFAVQHNIIADKIKDERPKYDDDRIFEEARRVMIAVYQRMVYEDYLPKIIGPTYMSKFDLNPLSTGFYNKYDPKVDASLSAEFGTSAFRLHSTTRDDFIRMTNNNRTQASPAILGDNQFYADVLYDKSAGHHDSIAHGMMFSRQMQMDNQFADGIRNRIFETRGKRASGVDLAAVHVQRGRDLGVGGYNSYRQLVGLRRANKFSDLSGEISSAKISLLSSVYSSVDDIDLYVGMNMENLVVGGTVGPTMAYMIGEQFTALKRGDRFYYENSVAGTRMSPDELAEIRSYDIRNIFCAGSESSPNIPADLFTYGSPMQSCAKTKPINLAPFLLKK